MNTLEELKKKAEELNAGEEIDWNNSNQMKYYICYNYYDNKLIFEYSYGIKNLGQIYCLNENFLEIAKEKIGEERLIKLFKEEKDNE